MSSSTFDQDRIERWFIRRGVPHFIDGYSAREDILTRAAPVLVVIAVAEVFLVFDDRFEGWAQAGLFVVALCLLAATAALVNRFRGRSPFALPDDVGLPEVVGFVVGPALVAVVGSLDFRAFPWIVAAQLIILAVVFWMTSYGVPSMAVGAVSQVVRELGSSLVLAAKTLPVMLVFSLFLFINAEVWKIADDWNPWYFLIICVAMGLLICGFVAASVRDEALGLETFDDWFDVYRWSYNTPVEGHRPLDDSDAVATPPLSRRSRTNVSLMLFMNHLMQVIIVVVAVFAIYVGFGLLSIRELTIRQWIGVDRVDPADIVFETTWLGTRIILTHHLLMVSVFISLLCGIQFAIAQVAQRSEPTEDLGLAQSEIRESLAVRAVYLASLREM